MQGSLPSSGKVIRKIHQAIQEDSGPDAASPAGPVEDNMPQAASASETCRALSGALSSPQLPSDTGKVASQALAVSLQPSAEMQHGSLSSHGASGHEAGQDTVQSAQSLGEHVAMLFMCCVEHKYMQLSTLQRS